MRDGDCVGTRGGGSKESIVQTGRITSATKSVTNGTELSASTVCGHACVRVYT
jgi:hypothetical protein